MRSRVVPTNREEPRPALLPDGRGWSSEPTFPTTKDTDLATGFRGGGARGELSAEPEGQSNQGCNERIMFIRRARTVPNKHEGTPRPEIERTSTWRAPRIKGGPYGSPPRKSNSTLLSCNPNDAATAGGGCFRTRIPVRISSWVRGIRTHHERLRSDKSVGKLPTEKSTPGLPDMLKRFPSQPVRHPKYPPWKSARVVEEPPPARETYKSRNVR